MTASSSYRPAGSAAGSEESRAQRTEEVLKAFHEEAALGKAYDTRLVARLWPYVRPHRRLVWLSLGVGVLTATGAVSRPFLMRYIIDDGVMAKRPEVLMYGGAAFSAVVVLEQLLNFVQVYSVQIAGARAMADLRRRVFDFLHGLKLAFFDQQPIGRLVTRVTNDIDAILELFASGALNAFVDMLKLVGIVAIMLSLDWKLSLVAFAAAPLVGLLVSFVRRRAREAFREIRAKTARMNATMNEQISGMTVVQAFGREQGAQDEFDVINAAYRDANIRSIKYEAVQDAAIEMVAAVCLASIVVSLGYRPVSFGTVVAFNAYLIMFFEPITALAQRYTLLQSAMAGAERVFTLLDTRAPDAPTVGDTEAPADAGFAFEHVQFGYKPGQPVMRDVSFQVRDGEKIALVGATGAGKSTVASLLLRLYDVDRGVVRVGGRDVRSVERSDLRRRFAVVPQDVFLFPGTVATNVAIGDDEPDRDRVVEALRRIDAYDLFMRRPGGIDAPVEERGENFSAGERQLIAFARALYRDAPILILDEATASVDSDTEARLQHALEELLKGRTALIIAHRLSTIRAVDRILVFHRGRLVEQGTHDELLEAGGIYARLHALHFARGDRSDPAASSAPAHPEAQPPSGSG